MFLNSSWTNTDRGNSLVQPIVALASTLNNLSSLRAPAEIRLTRLDPHYCSELDLQNKFIDSPFLVTDCPRPITVFVSSQKHRGGGGCLLLLQLGSHCSFSASGNATLSLPDVSHQHRSLRSANPHAVRSLCALSHCYHVLLSHSNLTLRSRRESCNTGTCSLLSSPVILPKQCIRLPDRMAWIWPLRDFTEVKA